MPFWDRGKEKEEKKLEEKVEEKKEEFSLEDFVQKYPEEVRPFLIEHGNYLNPNLLLANYEMTGRAHEEIYILGRGTAEEINKFWEERYPNLKTKDGKKITGVYVANVLREIFTQKTFEASKGTKKQISKENARELFPKLEELYQGPEEILVYQG